MSARCSVPLAAAALAAALLAAPAAHAQAPAPAQRITAVAAGRAPVNRDIAQNSKAIAAAVEAARNRAIPAVSEPQPSPFFGGPVGAAYGAEGTFGPGKFCGRIRTPIRRRSATGQLRSTGRFRTLFGCRAPSDVAQTVSATFAVS
jgi:hypothetical protein